MAGILQASLRTASGSRCKKWMGKAYKSSGSNGNSNYQLDISGNMESQLRERSIPMMKENNVPVKQLTEAFWIDWKIPSENYFDMKVPDAFNAVADVAFTRIQQ